MTTIKRSIIIDAPASDVWPAIADFGGIATWNPNVKTSKLTSTQTEGTDITRECQLAPMGTVQERVTEWIEGRLMSVEIFEFKNVPAMRSANATFELVPMGSQTKVNLQMDYQVGFGPVGAGMNAIMMKRQFQSAATKMVAGLKLHIETGAPVAKGAQLPTSAVSVA